MHAVVTWHCNATIVPCIVSAGVHRTRTVKTHKEALTCCISSRPTEHPKELSFLHLVKACFLLKQAHTVISKRMRLRKTSKGDLISRGPGTQERYGASAGEPSLSICNCHFRIRVDLDLSDGQPRSAVADLQHCMLSDCYSSLAINGDPGVIHPTNTN
jgi:hypothetical protein